MDVVNLYRLVRPIRLVRLIRLVRGEAAISVVPSNVDYGVRKSVGFVRLVRLVGWRRMVAADGGWRQLVAAGGSWRRLDRQKLTTALGNRCRGGVQNTARGGWRQLDRQKWTTALENRCRGGVQNTAAEQVFCTPHLHRFPNSVVHFSD